MLALVQTLYTAEVTAKNGRNGHVQSTDGIPLQGILYKPENFDPSKKYPMIVYLYEKLSQNLNHFVDPRPMDSINISYYVSNGYLVFTPDIVYTTGYPGQSALKCVLGGVNAVSDILERQKQLLRLDWSNGVTHGEFFG